jgi:hypothetical protein
MQTTHSLKKNAKRLDIPSVSSEAKKVRNIGRKIGDNDKGQLKLF